MKKNILRINSLAIPKLSKYRNGCKILAYFNIIVRDYYDVLLKDNGFQSNNIELDKFLKKHPDKIKTEFIFYKKDIEMFYSLSIKKKEYEKNIKAIKERDNLVLKEENSEYLKIVINENFLINSIYPKQFVCITIEEYLKLTSRKYYLGLYTTLKLNKKYGRRFTIYEFKNVFNIPSSYCNAKITANILNPFKKFISEIFGINIKIEYQNIGKKRLKNGETASYIMMKIIPTKQLKKIIKKNKLKEVKPASRRNIINLLKENRDENIKKIKEYDKKVELFNNLSLKEKETLIKIAKEKFFEEVGNSNEITKQTFEKPLVKKSYVIKVLSEFKIFSSSLK